MYKVLIRAAKMEIPVERDRGFERPAFLKSTGLEVPHGVPIHAVQILVRDLPVRSPTDWIDGKISRVAAIVKRVGIERDVVAAEDATVVTPHLIGNDTLRVRVPAANGDIQVGTIEHDPHLGLLGRRRAMVGLDLDEVRDGRDLRVDGFIELTIDANGRCDPHGANRRTARRVPPDHVGRDRRRRPVEGERKVGP